MLLVPSSWVSCGSDVVMSIARGLVDTEPEAEIVPTLGTVSVMVIFADVSLAVCLLTSAMASATLAVFGAVTGLAADTDLVPAPEPAPPQAVRPKAAAVAAAARQNVRV